MVYTSVGAGSSIVACTLSLPSRNHTLSSPMVLRGVFRGALIFFSPSIKPIKPHFLLSDEAETGQNAPHS
jgi:hypothetical protein